MSTKRVVIVGGEVAELGTAYTLMNRGTALLLIEAEDQVGDAAGVRLRILRCVLNDMRLRRGWRKEVCVGNEVKIPTFAGTSGVRGKIQEWVRSLTGPRFVGVT